VAAGDLNGDGFPDLAVANAFAFTRLLLGRGDGTFAPSSTSFGGENISVVMGHLNGDAFLDLAIAIRSSTQTFPDRVAVLVNTTGLAMDRPVAVCGDGQATVSWTAPAAASVVAGYVVTPFVGYNIQPSTTFNSTATTQTVTGLTNGTQYRFKVAARNAVGVGPTSKVSNPVTVAPPTVPGPPTIGTAAPGNAEATVSWTAPSPEVCPAITGYVVTPYVGFFPKPSTTFNSTANTQTVTGLTNGTTYRFRVQAINTMGTGGYSKVTNPVTPT